ncbi:MAG TPA: hypothetical protein VN207_08255 [Ktedonobacteraceae bacterium]|nr:hypothetical protein [Ktedonobacteraceae bacterium]
MKSIFSCSTARIIGDELNSKEGIDDALIQPSGHATRQSLEIYSKLSLADAQSSYNRAMEQFPIQ